MHILPDQLDSVFFAARLFVGLVGNDIHIPPLAYTARSTTMPSLFQSPLTSRRGCMFTSRLHVHVCCRECFDAVNRKWHVNNAHLAYLYRMLAFPSANRSAKSTKSGFSSARLLSKLRQAKLGLPLLVASPYTRQTIT